MAVVTPAEEAQRRFDRNFDANQPITLQGRVIKFEWGNPRSQIHMDVIDSGTGKQSRWTVEAGSPSALLRAGWIRSTLPPGTEITVPAFRARDGSNHASAADIGFPDGGRLTLGNAPAEAAIAAAAAGRAQQP